MQGLVREVKVFRDHDLKILTVLLIKVREVPVAHVAT